MEKRFTSNEHLHNEYSKFIQELIDLWGTWNQPVHQATHYMRHHVVVKDTSTTTKSRVVFNASMKTWSRHSLNDALMVGLQLQQDLFSILVRFRTHPTVFVLTSKKCIGRSTLPNRILTLNVLFGVSIRQNLYWTTAS